MVRRRRFGTTSAPSPSPTTSPWRCCRLTVPNSTPSSGFAPALPTRTLPIAPRPRRHRGHHRRACCQGMDRPHRRTGSYANPLRLSIWIMKVISRLTGIRPYQQHRRGVDPDQRTDRGVGHQKIRIFLSGGHSSGRLCRCRGNQDFKRARAVGRRREFGFGVGLSGDQGRLEPEGAVFVRKGHPKALEITVDTALDGVGIPLHPGAERYYREIGLLK